MSFKTQSYKNVLWLRYTWANSWLWRGGCCAGKAFPQKRHAALCS